jgi:DNA (cytosine-5)-methyltransferase 1
MNHASLFSGIGGFDLAAEWAGWNNLFHCEWNPFGQQVLKHHFPNSISYNDITKTDFTIHKGTVDILTGGFPCQPYSSAGKRLGKEDERHLWPEMLRCIQEVKPRWVVGENVRGLVNWDGGLVFHEVQSDLESQGYSIQPFLIPACAKNAPHRRDRVWFIAYSKSIGLEYKIPKQKLVGQVGLGERIEWDFQTKESLKSGLCWQDDGISKRLDGITFSKWRKESVKAYGNAIVPQVAFEIFKTINTFEEQLKNL